MRHKIDWLTATMESGLGLQLELELELVVQPPVIEQTLRNLRQLEQTLEIAARGMLTGSVACCRLMVQH